MNKPAIYMACASLISVPGIVLADSMDGLDEVTIGVFHDDRLDDIHEIEIPGNDGALRDGLEELHVDDPDREAVHAEFHSDHGEPGEVDPHADDGPDQGGGGPLIQ